MKFNNAYDLILFLYNKGLFQGLHVSLRGEYEIETSIKNPRILSFLEDIWNDFSFIYQGFYDLILDDKNLGFTIDIADDILDFDGSPFKIEDILSIINEQLNLKFIDKEENLEYQICIDLELEYQNLEKTEYKFQQFTISSSQKDDEISKELSSKLKGYPLTKIKEDIVDYCLKTHKKHHSYEGFGLKIEDNDISRYDGTGCVEIKNLKQFLQAKEINLLIDISDL
jgi:hypothetical protein